MNWTEAQNRFPNKWLVIEALSAHSKDNLRIPDDISIIDDFDSPEPAFKRYKEIHRQEPGRELLVVHTSRNDIKMEVIHWIGIRTA